MHYYNLFVHFYFVKTVHSYFIIFMVKEVLGEYSGYIHCDMWGAYRQATNAKLVGCWAHVRRKFFEANPKLRIVKPF